MKRIVLLLVFLLAAVLLIVSCGNTETPSSTAITTPKPAQTAAHSTGDTTVQTTANTTVTTTAITTVQTTAGTTAGTLQLIDGDKPIFQVVTSLERYRDSFFNQIVNDFCVAVRDIGVTRPTYSYDQGRKMDYEILIGKTNRDVKLPDLDPFEWVTMVQGTKIILYSETDSGLLRAIDYFVDTYLSEKDGALTLPGDLYTVGRHDPLQSAEHEKTYAEMATEIWDAFNDEFWNGAYVEGVGFWESAEILEIYADAYELTGDEAIKEKLLAYADRFVLVNKRDWLWKIHNDSPMWASIAFSRITLLTGERKYYEIAKENFDAVYARSFDKTLGGGLYWDVDKTTKNACVNGPAAIAACYIAKISGDESYFEKARDLMAWEIDRLFEKDTGKVYDAQGVTGGVHTWSSTYNQGTLIGACTLLYQHYGDKAYLDYAQKAADYARANLTELTFGVLDNNEVRDGAQFGFKGIFARWAIRYAKETNNVDLLLFLQHNADVAYGNRNEKGLIWTSWHVKTPTDPVAEKHNAFSMSTAVSLLYNCQAWW
ncbi:MAG: hypothetical protein IJD35_02040 [Clostridia bacterium]|nr:hypothetical protein [Clostridia bacterium]